MPRFVLTYHEGHTPQEPTKETMDSWVSWFGGLGDAVVDMGSPFRASTTIASDGNISVGARPHPASGCTVIKAAGMDEAAALASGCPGLTSGCPVRLYEQRSLADGLP